ncbi:SPOR domain-containing protein [candidate division KSB1 bacterium]
MRFKIIIILIISTVYNINVNAQEINLNNLPDLEEYIKFYESGLITRIQRELPYIEEKYGTTPETMFFNAVLEENGDNALAIYSEILRNFPESPVVEHTLFRVGQFNFAKEQFHTAKRYFLELMEKYPETRYFARVQDFLYSIDNNLQLMPERAQQNDQDNIKPEEEFVVQFGAYSIINNARHMKEHLQNSGYTNIEIIKHIVGNSVLYKVWLRGYKNRSAALIDAENIKSRYKFGYTIFVNK